MPDRPVRAQRSGIPAVRAGKQHHFGGVEHTDRLGDRAQCTDDGAEPRRGHDHSPHAAACRRGCRSHAGPQGHLPRRQCGGGIGASPCSTTGAHRRSGFSWTATGTPPTRAARDGPCACGRTWRSASRVGGCAPGTYWRRVKPSIARCRGRRNSPHRKLRKRLSRNSMQPRGSGGAGSATHVFPTTGGGRRFSGPPSQSGLTYMPTGATVTALTTSLPETPGGERNWDYRYTWMRDSTFTLQALHYLNLDWEADEFMQFIADLESNGDGALQIMYGIDGTRDLTESTRDDLSGCAGARPVRIGNGAFDQRQNDVFGAVLDSILLHTVRSKRLPRRLWPLVQQQATCASAVWRNPDQGIWEARGAPQHYVSSKLMCWVALDRASKIAGIRGDRSAEETWRATAEEIRVDILEHGGEERDSAPALRHRGADRVDPARRDLRLPSPRGRPPAHHRRRHRERSHRRRIRPALPHRRNRRRVVGQGRQFPDLLVLAGVSTDRGRTGAGGNRFDGGWSACPLPSGCTPRSSTRAPAVISAIFRRRSPTSR